MNISGKELQEEGFSDRIAAALEAGGIAPALPELEITEGTLMSDIERSRANLLQLKRTGASISIDDFGTGYSSPSYLKNFPIDVLKIDQSFVRDMLYNTQDASIISAILHLAPSLHIALLAEGVEQEGQAIALMAMRCYTMQGSFFARPMPLEVLWPLLAAGRVPAR